MVVGKIGCFGLVEFGLGDDGVNVYEVVEIEQYVYVRVDFVVVFQSFGKIFVVLVYGVFGDEVGEKVISVEYVVNVDELELQICQFLVVFEGKLDLEFILMVVGQSKQFFELIYLLKKDDQYKYSC